MLPEPLTIGWLPTAAGLLAIPLLIAPLDVLAHWVRRPRTRPHWPTDAGRCPPAWCCGWSQRRPSCPCPHPHSDRWPRQTLNGSFRRVSSAVVDSK